MPSITDIISVFEQFAPIALQEGYDNSGLTVGDPAAEVKSALIAIDVTEEVVQEAIDNHCQLIVSHHPITLNGFKKLTGQNGPERSAIKAIRHNIAIYSAHTNADSVPHGVSGMMAKKLGLINQEILEPKKDALLKLVTFVPQSHADKVRQALFDAGAGHIGNYDSCSFNSQGTGTFKGNEQSNPFAGQKNTMHTEAEIKIETILPRYLKSKVVKALLTNHPYEEAAYDLYPLANQWSSAGYGIVGDLPEKLNFQQFLAQVKDTFNCGCVRYTEQIKQTVSRVALCGGSGSSLLSNAIASGADVFITGDFKYHQFFDAEKRIAIADIGHYESEQFTKELFFELLTKKFPNFAVRLSQVNSNPIKYL
jgi:dinuclear metal center YbgI/SA1388 family protein